MFVFNMNKFMIWCGFLWVQTYSNYSLSPNFEGTNVSALGGKEELFSIYFKGFQCRASSFFYGGVAWGLSVTV